MKSAQPNVAEYAVSRLAALGIDRAFGVPGDYTFPVDDAIETTPGLQWVVCANELNAAYAADGYARRRGAAILTTTYAVGELSALNGVMGAKAHRLPVFHLVGAPALRIQRAGLVTHHSLGHGTTGEFAPLSAAACCVGAQLTPENAVTEMDRVIREAFRASAPAYIQIPMDVGTMPLLPGPGGAGRDGSIAALRRRASVPSELAGALAAVRERLRAAQRPVALATFLLARCGLAAQAGELLAQMRLPYATTPMDKGVLPETHPCFVGTYSGQGSSPGDVRPRVEEADLVLDLGGVILADFNTTFWTAAIDPSSIVTLGPDYVKAGDRIYTQVALADMLEGLAASAPVVARTWAKPASSTSPPSGNCGDRLTSADFYRRLERMIGAGDTIVCETGSCLAPVGAIPLPEGSGFESDVLWGSIGWATPAAMGIAMAEPSRRAILVTGDGSHQLTANEIGVMGRYGVEPVIFVLNNGIYGVEAVLSETGHCYNDVARWRYHEVPAAMGCRGWYAARVETVGELEQAIAAVQAKRVAAYIEVVLPPEESRPLPGPLLDRIYRTRPGT